MSETNVETSPIKRLVSWFIRRLKLGQFSSAWCWFALFFSTYNWLVKGHANEVDMFIACALINFYFMSRICEILQSIKDS
jgi:hypothetical protein